MNNNNTLKNYLYINVIYFSERGDRNETDSDQNERDDQNDNRSESYRKTQAAYASFLTHFKTAGQNLLAAFEPNEQNRSSTNDVIIWINVLKTITIKINTFVLFEYV